MRLCLCKIVLIPSRSILEACDDGNEEDGDGCDSSCSLEAGGLSGLWECTVRNGSCNMRVARLGGDVCMHESVFSHGMPGTRLVLSFLLTVLTVSHITLPACRENGSRTRVRERVREQRSAMVQDYLLRSPMQAPLHTRQRLRRLRRRWAAGRTCAAR